MQPASRPLPRKLVKTPKSDSNALPMAAHAAAVAEAAVEGWEEALDVDDSDLRQSLPPSLPLPFLRPCSSHTLSSPPLPPQPPPQPLTPPPPAAASLRRIPGPAAAVQAAMRRRFAGTGGGDCEEAARLAAADAAAGDEDGDGDFQLNPWLCAVRFLGEEQPWERPGIGAIGGRRPFHRASRVVGVVKSCAPNGLGDLFLTLKDPTGTISASVHRKVLSEGNLGFDISIGCVVILKQVVVFCPSRSACYLNVTLENVVKVFGRDCGPPSNKVVSSITTNRQLHAKLLETGKEAEDQGHTDFAKRAETETSERTRGICGKKLSGDKAGSADSVAAIATSSILRQGKGTGYASEKRQEISLPEVAGGTHDKHISSNSANKQLQNILYSMNATSSQPRQGSSAKSINGAAAGNAANEKMRGLFSGDCMVSSSKQAKDAEVFPEDDASTPAASNNISRKDTDIGDGFEKHRETELQEMAAGLHSKDASSNKTSMHRQQNLHIPDMSYTQPGSSIEFGNGARTATTANEKFRRLLDDKWMASFSKKPRIDTDEGAGTTNIRFVSGMNCENNSILQNPLVVGLGDMAEDLHSKHISNRTADEIFRQNLSTAHVDIVQPSLGGSSASVTGDAALTRSISSNPVNEKNEPERLVPTVSVAGWTDEQLAELFAD